MLGKGRSIHSLLSFYQPKISPAEVSSVLVSIQMLLRRVSKGLESFSINKRSSDIFCSPDLSSGNYYGVIMQCYAVFWTYLFPSDAAGKI